MMAILIVAFSVVLLLLFRNGTKNQQALSQKNEELLNENRSLLQEKSELSGEISVLREQMQQKKSEMSLLSENFQRLSSEKIAVETMRNEVLKSREQLKAELTNLSQEILDSKQRKFSDETKKEIGLLIADLQKEFSIFKNEIFSPETKSRTELSTHLNLLLSSVEKMQTEAENLTNALRSNSKVQGDWGEIQLENLLEQAGLSEEQGDFIKQGKGLKLMLESGAAKPDFLVRLPKDQWILIDAKVSLSAYERMINTDDPEQRTLFLEQHRLSVRKHIDEVAKYHQIKNSIDICPFLLLFLPIESAYASAISDTNSDKKDIAEYARQNNVIIVYPSTLFLTLRLIQAIWQVEKQNLNAQEIAERGGRLYDKFSGLLDELREVYKLFKKMNEQFEEKIVPKINGRGGLLMQCDELQKLGIKNKKNIKSESLIEG